MSYSLMKKNVVMIAFMFTAMVAFSQTGYAQAQADAQPQADVQPQADAQPQAADGAAANAVADNTQAQNTQAPEQNSEQHDDLFGLDENSENTQETEQKPDNGAAPVSDSENPAPTDNEANNAAEDQNNTIQNTVGGVPDNGLNNISAADVAAAQGDVSVDGEDGDAPVADAPKSPFESFGNTILSKVDNSLFSQMSDIEKQTTILNLEYKREEVRNRIEALRMQRIKARQEEAARLKKEEEQAKNEETKRKIQESEAEEKLKKVETELEKVRQAKVLNEYMNQMLVTNQQWVEKNANLQNQVKQLRDERRTLIKNFETQIAAIRREIASTLQKANTAKSAHDRSITSLESQIRNLKKSVVQTEEAMQQLKSGNAANPFASGIDEDAIDMSNEYAIMDITGKGKDIIAKILNKDGTTFIVHEGSMLKGGEVVTTITDNYIAFDNNGVKSYLYTGGTVREYEPEKSFNGADKTPMAATGVINNNSAVRNVRGASIPSSGTTRNQAAEASAKDNSAASDKGKKTSKPINNTLSLGPLGSGMFVK